MLLTAIVSGSHGTHKDEAGKRQRSDPRIRGQALAAADKLRNNMDAAEYKHVVLGLIFLKYISDAFEEKHAKLIAEQDQGADPEDPDEYRADGIFWVPKEARWPPSRQRQAADHRQAR